MCICKQFYRVKPYDAKLQGKISEMTEQYQKRFKSAKEVGDRFREGGACHNLGIIYLRFGDLKQAMDCHDQMVSCHKQHLRISEELGDLVGEGLAYGSLGRVNRSLSSFKQAIVCHTKQPRSQTNRG